MENLHTRIPFGDLGVERIREGNGYGFQATGLNVQSPMPIGFLAIGNQGEEAGSGLKAIGSTVEIKVKSGEF